jgi:hypothetical protein
MTQAQSIIRHLSKTGSISQREAMLEYGVASLTKAISRLRKNYTILDDWHRNPITEHRYKRYWVIDRDNFKKEVAE